MAHHVYALVDPRDGQIFYVGYTSCHPRKRLREHHGSKDSAAWGTIQSILKSGGAVGMRVLASFENRDDALDAERRYIQSMPGLVNRQSYWPEAFDTFKETTTVEPDLDYLEHEEDIRKRNARSARLSGAKESS